MRLILVAVALSIVLSNPVAAADLTIITPGFVIGGLRTLAASYEKETGNKITVSGTDMGQMMDTIKLRGDVVVLPSDLMNEALSQRLLISDTRKPLGRVEIVMIVPKGAPHPDISTVAETAAAIKGAKQIAYSNPFTAEKSKQAMIIHNILQRPEFLPNNGKPPEKGNAVAGIKEGADMGLQLHSQINDPAVEDVGPLPPSLGAFMDGEIAVSSKAQDPKAALEFVSYLLRPSSTATWKSHGVDRR